MSSAFALLSDPIGDEDATQHWQKPKKRRRKRQTGQSILAAEDAGSNPHTALDAANSQQDPKEPASGLLGEGGETSAGKSATHAAVDHAQPTSLPNGLLGSHSSSSLTRGAGMHAPASSMAHAEDTHSSVGRGNITKNSRPVLYYSPLAAGTSAKPEEAPREATPSDSTATSGTDSGAAKSGEEASTKLGTGNGAAKSDMGAGTVKSGTDIGAARSGDDATTELGTGDGGARSGAAGARSEQAMPSGTAPPNSSFGQYLWAELNPNAAAPPSTMRQGLLERQRVYNAILFVPFQLERLLWYGLLVCLDSFLAVFTVLPVRLLGALSTAVGPLRRRGGSLHGNQLFDVLCAAIFGATIAFLRFLPAGTIYFWLKDLTQEFLKLHVVHGAVEIFDKISCAFVVDALEALSGTCGLYLSSSGRRWHLAQLGADLAVTLALVLLHSVVLICQFMTFSVAMNSKRSNALIALLIASNFVEIKGTVFKRFDPAKLFVLVGQDVTERFHLLLSLLFVVVEEMDNSGSARPSPELLWRCGYIFGAEILIDVTKHAVLSKLNDIRPTVYQRFMRDVCEKAKGGQSHTSHRVVAFEPYAPAALFLRIAVTALVVSRSEQPLLQSSGWQRPWQVASLGAYCIAAWAAVFMAKAALGFSIRSFALHFLKRHPKA